MPSLTTSIYLIKEFFQIGLFSFGGGYSTLPFLYNLIHSYDWYSAKELSQMIAVATITPGPVAINVATYAGMKAGGIISAIIATTSEIIPALIIGLIVSKLLKNFSDNSYVKSVLRTLKPTSCALLSYVAIKLFYHNILLSEKIYPCFGLFIILLLFSVKQQRQPLWYIFVSAVYGILLTAITL